jgi:hypothetical protein
VRHLPLAELVYGEQEFLHENNIIIFRFHAEADGAIIGRYGKNRGDQLRWYFTGAADII